jgi:anaerobic magnesium-protoporphyrin IX monomethyl ester cyclase
MNILFISTDMDPWALGMRSVSAVLKEAGHSTRLIFLPTRGKLYSKDILDRLDSFVNGIDLIGITCLARGSDKAKQIIEWLRPFRKLIVWGGVHASLNPEECANWADIVCRGEGEEMMVELVERLKNRSDWKDIRNITFKENDTIITNPVRPPISHLDSLPLPDFSFDEEYHLSSNEIVKVDIIPKVKNIYFNSSRGCAFYCTYCCNEKIKNIYKGEAHYVRRMSIPRLIEHAQHLKSIFREAKSIYFLDEDFAARPVEELVQFSELYPQKVGLPFECLAHPARITKQKMDLLSKAGLWRLNMGVESGSERTRKQVYNRLVSNKAIKRAAEIICVYPYIVPYYFLIIGNPYEEAEDLVATARLISELPTGFHLIIYNLVFFPGSTLYQRAVLDHLIAGNQESGHELDFLKGFDHTGISWKQKNIYLNGVLFLMGGKARGHFLGTVPRLLVDRLLQPPMIEFNQNHPGFIEAGISVKFAINSIRHLLAKFLKNMLEDYTVIYNIRYRLFKAFKSGVNLDAKPTESD